MARILKKTQLDKIIARGNVFGPVEKGGVSEYRLLEDSGQLRLDIVLPQRPLKELFFPRTEPILSYSIGKQRVETAGFGVGDDKRIIFGARPCDAAGLAIDDKLFSWDSKDELWFKRRENTTIVTIACTHSDEFCMCSSLKLAPDSSKGSDVLLRELKDESGWMLEVITEKGDEFVREISEVLIEGDAELAETANVPVKFDIDRVRDWLSEDDNFDSKLWGAVSSRCISCGTCTYLCPTCHCFDIQDEGDTYNGVRRKNWDSCSFAMFTQHTSGHNPRPTTASRWRQRIMHKFNYYPKKFDVVSCTGCGRCTRNCPEDMGITETMQTIVGAK